MLWPCPSRLQSCPPAHTHTHTGPGTSWTLADPRTRKPSAVQNLNVPFHESLWPRSSCCLQRGCVPSPPDSVGSGEARAHGTHSSPGPHWVARARDPGSRPSSTNRLDAHATGQQSSPAAPEPGLCNAKAAHRKLSRSAGCSSFSTSRLSSESLPPTLRNLWRHREQRLPRAAGRGLRNLRAECIRGIRGEQAFMGKA